MTSTANSQEDKILELLASGIPQNEVAAALGLSDGRISQLVADENFSRKLAEAKYQNLVKHNETDNIYDSIELKLAKKLEQNIPLMMRPMEITRALQTVNSLKRRGVSSPDSITRTKPTVHLNIPIAVINQFKMNAAGQVISAGIGNVVQDLVTIQSGNMKELVNAHLPKLQNSPSPTLKESDGQVWRKPQGRESHDILSECGFSVDIEVSSQPQG